MAVFKETGGGYGKGYWRVACYYTDWQGVHRKHEKRGFTTKHEAQEYERAFLLKADRDINMSFDSFIDIYLENLKPQIRLSTFLSKKFFINKHIRPYFMTKTVSDITPTDILQWQNELLMKRDETGRGYAPTTLRTIQNQMNAIFNHAVNYYGLPVNPCRKNKKMGKSKNAEMLFWTMDEYLKFREAIKRKPISYYAFEVLYWTGIRCGELLALTRKDFDLENKTLKIDKSLQILEGEVHITPPKTEKSNRTISLPDFLVREMEDYFESLYKLDDKTRIFPISKSYLAWEMIKGSERSGVKRIRIHDLRHSHCALLIKMGYSTVQIGERLGHESTVITDRYAHLYPSVQRDMATEMNNLLAISGADHPDKGDNSNE